MLEYCSCLLPGCEPRAAAIRVANFAAFSSNADGAVSSNPVHTTSNFQQCKSVTFSLLPAASTPRAAPRAPMTRALSSPTSNRSFATFAFNTANARQKAAQNSMPPKSSSATRKSLPGRVPAALCGRPQPTGTHPHLPPSIAPHPLGCQHRLQASCTSLGLP